MPRRQAKLEQVLRPDVVERLDHAAAQLLCDPAALRKPRLDRRDVTVALWVVVAGVDHGGIVLRVVEHAGRQLGILPS